MKAQPGARIEPHDLQQRTGDPHVTEQTRGASPRQLARIAGALYLINIVLGAFATAIVPAIVVVSGDAAATAHNIQTHELLYRLGLVAHPVVTVTNVPPALIFYELFKGVNRRLALLDAFFILVATAIEAAGLLHGVAPLVLLGSGPSERGHPDVVHANGGTGMKAVLCCRYAPPQVVEVVELASQACDRLVAKAPDTL